LRGAKLGPAWLSSARGVRDWVKSRNERNPYVWWPACNDGDSKQTAGVSREEGGDDVKPSWHLRPGLRTCYNGRYSGLLPGNRMPISQSRPQFGSGPATRPREAGFASNRVSAMTR